MNQFASYALAAVLFVLGLAAIGGAALGHQRNRRLWLAVIGAVLWGLTLLVYNQAIQQHVAPPQPTTTPEPVAATQPPTAPTIPITGSAVISGSVPLDVAALPPIGGKLVFHSDRAGELDIFTLDLANGEVQQLTNAAGRDFEPAWSPDGQTIVFSTDRDDPDNATCI